MPRYECLSCSKAFNSDLTETCPSCSDPVWWSRRLNLILLINELEKRNIPFSIRDLLFNPQEFEPYWLQMVNR